MSRPFFSSNGISGAKAFGIIAVLVFLGISWILAPYTVVSCNGGFCSVTRGEEHLESFKTSEIKDCNIIVKERQIKRRNRTSSIRKVNVYYPVIMLKNGRKIQPQAFDYAIRSGADDFCYSLMSNPNFHYKVK